MTVTVSCQCGANLKAKDELAGKRVKCPTCGQPLVLPVAAGAAERIPVACECGQSFKAKHELAGKRVKCPKCGATLQVPSGHAAPDPIVDLPTVDAADLVPLDDLEHVSSPLVQGEQQSAVLPATGLQVIAQSPALGVASGQKKKKKSRSGRFKIDANTLRIIVLVLIAMDALQSGIWVLPSLLSSSTLLALVQSLTGWLVLFSLAAHVGLIVAGVGIFNGQEFGKGTASICATVLLGISLFGCVVSLVYIGTSIELIGVVGTVYNLVRGLITGIALPAGILVCVNHSRWRD